MHISQIYYNLLFGRSKKFYLHLSIDPNLCAVHIQSLLIGDHPPILGMATDGHMPIECGVINNWTKCLTNIY